MNNKRIISAAILLLITFWFGDLLAVQYFPDELNMPVREKRFLVFHYSDLLASMKEPPLWQKAKDRNAISYRLIYSPAKSFKKVVLRLDRITKKKWVLTVKQTDTSSDELVFSVNEKRPLAKEEINEFRKVFDALEFWQLPAVGALEAEDIMDGTIWILEAIENGRYHLVRRRSPKADIWISVPGFAEDFEKVRKEQGYPYIDRATSAEANKKLVAVGEFLERLSGLKLEMH